MEIAEAQVLAACAEKRDGAYRPDEYDRYWAREHALFLVLCRDAGVRYIDYLPGRYYTYVRLLDILKEHVGIGNGRLGEIGCGSGLALVLLAQSGVEAEGIDSSIAATCFAAALAESFGVSVRVQRKGAYVSGFPDGYFACTFNLGVLEHLSEKNQSRMLKEMARISSDAVVVFVPNCASPIYRMMDAMEHGSVPSDRVFACHEPAQDIDLIAPCERTGMYVVSHGAIHIAPPAPIPKSLLSDRSREFFCSLPRFEAACAMEQIEEWRDFERKLPQSLLEEFGWFKYVVCRTGGKGPIG